MKRFVILLATWWGTGYSPKASGTVGYLVAMTGAPYSLSAIILGFFLFRFFDIVKAPPANVIDRRLNNGCGVVLDDVVAGIFACLMLHPLQRIV